MRKLFFAIVLLCLFPVVCMSEKDMDTVSVELTSINTNSIIALCPIKILDIYTMEIYTPEKDTVIGIKSGKTYFMKGTKAEICPVVVLFSDSDVVKFKAAEKVYSYKGQIRIFSQNNRLKITNIADREEYVRNVLMGEIPANSPKEAVKAMAVAVRTYVTDKINRGDTHLCDTHHCQTYKGYLPDSVFGKAISETKGIILSYKGNPISTMFCADCGGVTQDRKEVTGKSDFPYLSAAKDPIEIKHIQWTYTIDRSTLCKKLKIKSFSKCIILSRYSGGRVKDMAFVTDKKTIKITGDSFRSLLGTANVKSTLFDIETKKDSLVIKGKGYGHGYGLCQTSAIQMAQQGWNYKQILSHFYKNTELLNIKDLSRTKK